MADATTAITLTLVHEGGYVDNPADPGGATKYGVTQRDMPSMNIKDITPAQAIAYYREHYWKPLYGEINDQNVANKLFDAGVLFGVSAAVDDLERALSIYVDGHFDAGILLLTNDADPVTLLAQFKAYLTTRAHAIALAKPAEGQFLNGWLRRIAS